jgi:16S rRNA (cytidine1402-2'-O)-methyltransferase
MPNQPQLFIVATPIGNLGDISPRAIETLKNVDMIACEDTRHSKKLLNHFEIKKPLISFYSQSDPEKILKLLRQEKTVALISDAGTPCISDPGFKLLQAAIKENVTISPIPGTSAIIAALSVSGFPANHFEFFGFIPHKKGRNKLLEKINELNHTAIFYESTHRIIKLLQQLHKIMPERQIILAREMTKIFEEFLRGTAEEILETINQNLKKQKGEFTVLVEPCEKH